MNTNTPRAHLALVVGVVLSALGCERGKTARAQLEPASSRADAAHPAASNMSASECGRCHAQIAAEWRSSGHAQAWTDPLVAREYLADPDPRCVSCHAPLTAAGQTPRDAAAHDGVDCVSCHLRAGTLIPAPELARAEACGACHQFRFLALAPGEAGLAYDPDAWLQDTLGEWSRSQAAAEGLSCQSCHMPLRGRGRARHRAHTFPGMYDPALVASAVKVELHARRQGGQVHVRATLEGDAIGHAFPTGDLFRSAVLRVWTEERDSASDSFSLRRSFAARPQSDPHAPTYLEPVHDTRVPPPGAGEPLRVDFRLRSPAGRRVGWSLELLAAGDDSPKTLVAQGSVAISE